MNSFPLKKVWKIFGENNLHSTNSCPVDFKPNAIYANIQNFHAKQVSANKPLQIYALEKIIVHQGHKKLHSIKPKEIRF